MCALILTEVAVIFVCRSDSRPFAVSVRRRWFSVPTERRVQVDRSVCGLIVRISILMLGDGVDYNISMQHYLNLINKKLLAKTHQLLQDMMHALLL